MVTTGATAMQRASSSFRESCVFPSSWQLRTWPTGSSAMAMSATAAGLQASSLARGRVPAGSIRALPTRASAGAPRGCRNVPSVEPLPPGEAGEAGDQLARSTQPGCRHVGLDDREQRRRAGQQQARAPIEPQQVRVPVPGIRRRRRPGDPRAQDSQELSRAPQDHWAIVRRGAASRWPGSSAPRTPAQGRSITPRPEQSRSLVPNEPGARPATNFALGRVLLDLGARRP